MKLSEIKELLGSLETVNFTTENGHKVPDHFHVTEVGVIDKHFIDCGGTVRKERFVNFQLWDAQDYDHRLKPQKLMKIIDLSEKALNIGDGEIEVEYQSDTIGKYGLVFNGKDFVLTNKRTDCLASDKCGIPEDKLKVNLSELSAKACCGPGSKCC